MTRFICLLTVTGLMCSVSAFAAEEDGVVRISDKSASSQAGEDIQPTTFCSKCNSGCGSCTQGCESGCTSGCKAGCQHGCQSCGKGWYGGGYGYGGCPYGGMCGCQACKSGMYGYFGLCGCCGGGCGLAGAYSRVYAVNPYHFDSRDGQIYASAQYGVPTSVPLATNVRHTYNYGWGIPSSRITPLSRTVPNPYVAGPTYIDYSGASAQ
ncbi:hypothetical protein [Calycomorphotria hydatis]|uniref:4Fe-4S ferredoxin-type domain-containing protein n=1 Tax=Calycomorphotria hydatis TaxID=2528027 RepID=A0A517TCH0_9PLAN|nr:hypothetical protein [Calycomorphotria hydatis]QDT66066.1 hypothetical protein V22_33300 [Calycomorphotria hydatis]